MLNYINAEWYKLRHKKAPLIGLALLLGLETLCLGPGFAQEFQNMDYAHMEVLAAFLAAVLPFGLFFAPSFAAYVYDGQYGQEALKNEIVYGIPRSRIYLGKLFTAILTGTGTAVVVLLWYFLFAALLAQNVGGLISETWKTLSLTLVAAWGTWVAALAFTFFLMFSFKSSALALTISYLFSGLSFSLNLVGYGVGSAMPPWNGDPLWWVARFSYTVPYHGVVQGTCTLGAGLVNSLAWVAGTTALGLWIFQKREVR